MNYEAVYRTAPATPGLLNIATKVVTTLNVGQSQKVDMLIIQV